MALNKGIYILHIKDYDSKYWYKVGFTENFDARFHNYGTELLPNKEYTRVFDIDLPREEIYQLEQKILKVTKDNHYYSKGIECRKYKDINELISVCSSITGVMGRPHKVKPQISIQELMLDKMLSIETKRNISNEICKLYGFKSLREIQQELYDTISTKLLNGESINGVVLWPTGVGKRHAIIITIILIYNYIPDMFRGLIIAPTNDIFETSIEDYEKLESIGITIIKAYGGTISKIKIPKDKPYLILATHQGCVSKINKDSEVRYIQTFKDLNFIAYDETHHISGERLYEYIKDNKPKHLLGVSATPMTRDTTQNDHIREIFGGTMPILSTCTYERAQKEGWINKCIFNTYLYTGDFEDRVESTIDKIKKTIERRIEKDIWRCKRIIYYVPSSLENLGKVKEVFDDNKDRDWIIHTTDDNIGHFKRNQYSGKTEILLACQKFREGSDLKGIEFTCVVVEGSIEPHIISQIQGRGMRPDYEGQISEMNIFKHKKADEEADQILYDILCSTITTIRKDKQPKLKEIEKMVKERIGEFEDCGGHNYTFEESVKICHRISCRLFHSKKELDMLYEEAVLKIKDLGITTEEEYHKKRDYAPDILVENPSNTYYTKWKANNGWYGYLSIDTSEYPKDLDSFKQRCQELDIWYEGDQDKFYALCKKNNLPYMYLGDLYNSNSINLFHIFKKPTRRRR